MKNTTLARALGLALLWMIPAQSSAAVITFDFLALIEEQSSPINGRLGNGTDYSGVPLSTSYDYFRWDYQGLDVTASALYRPEDIDGNVIEILPSFVFLQPHFAGLGVCHVADCAQASLMSYYDMLFLRFNQVVEITDIRFSRGQDDSNLPPEEDDYRAYNLRLDASGANAGPMSDLMGQGRSWQGSLFGNELSLYRTEGSGAFIESITVRTEDVFEPTSWSLLLLALLLGDLVRRLTRRKAWE
jgi:hypothetical protein